MNWSFHCLFCVDGGGGRRENTTEDIQTYREVLLLIP